MKAVWLNFKNDLAPPLVEDFFYRKSVFRQEPLIIGISKRYTSSPCIMAGLAACPENKITKENTPVSFLRACMPKGEPTAYRPGSTDPRGVGWKRLRLLDGKESVAYFCVYFCLFGQIFY